MTAARYRGPAGRVIAVTAGTYLADLVAAAPAGVYELVEAPAAVEDAPAGPDSGRQEPPAGEQPSPAGDPGPAPVDTLPPVPPAPAPAAPVAPPAPAPVAVDTDPAAAALLAQAYAVDTAEGVNSYLDEHPYAAELVLEHERATKARKGILEGRHAAPASS